MLTNYYTLRALSAEWNDALAGSILGDAYSQSKDECTLALANPATTWMLRISTRRAFPYAFRSEGYNRARRNVATLFASALDARIERIRLAERDRVLFLDFADGRWMQVQLFGPRPNVLLVRADGTIEEAFQHHGLLEDEPAPMPTPAPDVDTPDAFASRWPARDKDLARALSRALPLFDRDLAEEAIRRAGLAPTASAACSAPQLEQLFSAARAVEADLATPRPTLYWRGDVPDAFALIPLLARAGQTSEAFDTTDHALAVFVRRRLAQEQYIEVFLPLERQLAQAAAHYRQSGAKMLESLTQESRAERYERWGHLLMAQPAPASSAGDAVTVTDLFGDQQPVVIPLQPERTLLENARTYYEKARLTREARAHAEARLDSVERQAGEAERLLAALREQHTAADVRQFMKDEADAIAPFTASGAPTIDRLPFRRFDLGHGYEVWVGKSAQQNDVLTFQHARKFDLWMHARGVPGSHAVLRRPGRTVPVPRPILEQAAGIAAYFSKAKGSTLVPVIIAERKFVRKPKGAAPGAVLVEREQVVLVPPALPE
ncbi:MAG: NFACT RNA binding domain-containing protein [Rhodothermales bacterium]